MSRILVAVLLMLACCFSIAQNANKEQITNLNEPLYNPFVERYILDELKLLRVDLEKQNAKHIQQFVDREHSAVDRAVSYATDTVTYFFYLVAGAASVLVLVGWSSIHEAKTRVQNVADEKVSALIKEYESRLGGIEEQLHQKTKHIEENREEIELTQDIQALWLRAAQEISPASKIAIYDQILKLRTGDGEALSYKADAVLDLGEPQWAINLCQQSLEKTPNNSHALYQLACAYAAQEQNENALSYLRQAIEIDSAYKEEAAEDDALVSLKGNRVFKKLVESAT